MLFLQMLLFGIPDPEFRLFYLIGAVVTFVVRLRDHLWAVWALPLYDPIGLVCFHLYRVHKTLRPELRTLPARVIGRDMVWLCYSPSKAASDERAPFHGAIPSTEVVSACGFRRWLAFIELAVFGHPSFPANAHDFAGFRPRGGATDFPRRQ